MGEPKAWLRFGDEALLQRVVRRLGPAVSDIVVVAAPSQPVPQLPASVVTVRDPIEGLGPLAGIALGLRTLVGCVQFAYVTATDTPFVSPAFVRRLFALCDGDIVVPQVDGRFHPLAAIYRTQLGSVADELLATGARRPMALFDRARTRMVSRAELCADCELRASDPELTALSNVNTADDYRAALRRDAELTARSESHTADD
jgi:molybdopterin-guanine dinucleotide biosynthesis protein A